MLTSAYEVGWVKKGPKYAYIIFEWSLICCAGLDSNCITRAGHRLSGTDCTFHIFIGKFFISLSDFTTEWGLEKETFAFGQFTTISGPFLAKFPFAKSLKDLLRKNLINI